MKETMCSDIDKTKYVMERWRTDYNHSRPHSSLSYVKPAGFAELYRQAGYVRQTKYEKLYVVGAACPETGESAGLFTY